jgi:hydroxysqualene synthase
MHNQELYTKGKYWSADEGFRYCEKIVRSHYENFPVASYFVPRAMRKYVYSIYAFARIADDFADEPGFTLAERIDNLQQWEQYLDECYKGNPTHRVFSALAETTERFQIPIELFQNLLAAFRSDVTVKRYDTYEDVLAYCCNSANPIGRLILLLFNYRSETMMQLSDNICTALQLTNFWQDVSVDLQKDRIYIPLDDLKKFNYSEQELLNQNVNSNFCNLIAFQLQRTEKLFAEGKPLLSMVGKDLSLELKLTWNGGTSILRKIHQQDYDVLTKRTRLSTLDKLGLLFRSFLS